MFAPRCLFIAAVVFLMVPQRVQSQLFEYPVKFVCGRRPPPTPTQNPWDAVAPGSYRTAINIYNRNIDTVLVSSRIVTTQATPVPGTSSTGPAVSIPPKL